MPNGHAEERHAVWKRSRFWGVIWDFGDAVYYLGLLMSVILPLIQLGHGILHFESWVGLLRSLGFAILFFVLCFPIGLGVCGVLKAWAENRTGVTPR
jgi:hypothetical protein